MDICSFGCKWLDSGDHRKNLACPHSSWQVCLCSDSFHLGQNHKILWQIFQRYKSKCSREKEHMGLHLHKSLNVEEVTLSDILGASLETRSIWEGVKGKGEVVWRLQWASWSSTSSSLGHGELDTILTPSAKPCSHIVCLEQQKDTRTSLILPRGQSALHTSFSLPRKSIRRCCHTTFYI